MPALEAGIRAPEMRLLSLDGKPFSLAEALRNGPVVAAFFKVNCPVCQLAFPYLERIYKAYGGTGKFTMIGVSQNNAAETRTFHRDYGIRFPSLLDEKKYPVSNAYGLTNVPTVFVISTAGEIESTSVGWSRRDTEQLNRRLAALSGLPESPLFAAGERVPEYKPG